MTRKSCAVALSCTSTPASDIVKLIVNEEEYQQSMTLEDGVIAYPWHVDTKYYSADVHVCALEKKILGSPEFIDSVQAVIMFFDSKKNEGLFDAEQWESFIKECNPDIQILLCDRCEENPTVGISKVAALEWCIARGYELVELNPEKDEEWEESQDFLETTGAPRILQALHAHVWPDLKMKGESSTCPLNVTAVLVNPGASRNVQDLPSVDVYRDDGLCHELQSLRLREEALKTSFDTHILDGPPDALGSGGATDNFFELFQNLAEMKEHVSGMSTDDRKACAEQVVKAFWQAMGGDSDELSDGSDDAT